MGVRTGLAWLWGGNVEGFPKSDWEAAGVATATELDEWLALNVREPRHIDRWRAAGLKAPAEAKFWIALRQGPQDAVAWMRVCDPQEAREWIMVGYRPGDAQTWKGHGVAPLEIPLWKRFGVENGAAIVGWVRAGFKPDDARPWLASGVTDPTEALQWRNAAASPKVRSAWLKDGFSNQEALKLTAVGIGRKDARGMRDLGARSEDIPGWLALGEGAREVKRWIEAGVAPQEFTAWSQQGGWKAFKRWLGEGSSVSELREHTAGWASEGLSPIEAAAWLPVCRHPSIAAEWRLQGVSATDARRWCDAGYVTPREAASWLARARPPEWVKAWAESVGADAAEWYDLTDGNASAVAAWRAVGPASAPDVAAFAAALARRDSSADPLLVYQLLRAHHVNSLRLAQDWVDAFPISSAIEWLRAGVEAPVGAVAWVEAGFSPADVGEWRPVHAVPTVCAAWRSATGSASEALRWLRAGVSSPDDTATLRLAAVDPPEAERWIQLGVSSAESILRWRGRWGDSEAREWKRLLGTDLETAWDWNQVAQGDLISAAELLQAGYSPSTTRDWLEHVFAPSEMIGWRNAGCHSPDDAAGLVAIGVTIDEAVAWAGLGVALESLPDWRSKMPIAEASRWVDAVGSLDRVRSWQNFTSRHIAATFVRGGIAEPAAAQRWLDAGFAVDDAVNWARAELDPLAASQWMAAGLSQSQAAAWGGFAPDPEVAKEWMAVCPDDPTTAGMWARAGVTSPSRVVELSAIGLTARTHAALCETGLPEAEYRARLRVQASRYIGLDVADDGTLLLDVRETPPETVPTRLQSVLSAAAHAGERTIRVHHGAQRLSPDSVRHLPEARFIRGANKAAVLRYGWTLGEPLQFSVAPDGAHSEFVVEVLDSPSEFIHLGTVVGR